MKKYRRMAALLSAAAFIFGFAPALSQGALAITGPNQIIRPGKLLMLGFTSPLAGTADISLVSPAGETTLLYDDFSAKTGQNNFSWDGLLSGAPAAPGSYTLKISMGDDAASAPITVGELGPALNEVIPSDQSLFPGTPWHVHILASMAGTLTVSLEEENTLIFNSPVSAGETDVPWDGSISGAPLAPGTYTMILQLTDGTGYASNAHYIPVTIEESGQSGEGAAQGGASVQETAAVPQDTVVVASGGHVAPADFSTHPAGADEHDYWTLPMDITDEAAVWDVMMQPITVLEGNQKLAYKLRSEPRDDAEAVGEITYDSQGVRVLETLDSGWSLIEAYSSSFAGSKIKVWGEMVQGYVKTSLLQTKRPDTKYGLVLDKLTQRMYVFADGKLFTELSISTGLPNEKQPFNETQAGEYLIVSRVGQFLSDNLICDMALRFNNGNLIHQVPYTLRADGSKYFDKTEPKLGTKASHGCVRVQRRKNPEGVNMAWLWNNLENNTKVLIWEDYKGRQIPIPSADTPLYYNPNGGQYYHSDANCQDVKADFLPLAGFSYGQLEEGDFASLTRCPACAPPMRESELNAINAAYAE